ncbi:MAG: DNA repair protein RecN [Lachnospiraceae bacterium]|nr:DNA repair protein RecN [Lachnospiraceae bacterium]
MLINLHVKNLALIEEVDIDFEKGLVVLTGETGAGKSLILGSVNIALGNKVSKEIIRAGKENALVELTFLADDNCKAILQKYDLDYDSDTVTVSRKITENRSVSKINGETVNLSILKEVMTCLVDIYGQHDHQSLLYKSKHLAILDQFASDDICELKNEISLKYKDYMDLKSRLKEFDMDENERVRELEFAEFELNEIEDAAITDGEDFELEEEYKRISKSEDIINSLNTIYDILSKDRGVSELSGTAIGYINDVADFDESLSGIKDELYNIEALVKDVSREIYDYTESLSFDEERVREVEDRLNLINHLKMKYGNSVEEINSYCEEKRKLVERLTNYETGLSDLNNQIDEVYSEITIMCEKLSKLRSVAAVKLEKQITEALVDLNFLQVEFEIQVTRKDSINENGFDDVEFLISTNPGEPPRELGKVASGGELSRIMLAIKSILAGMDDVGTLIFDEIDTGISGVTAAKVANKLAVISRKRQVICISHLAQIAAMADYHYLIEKNIQNNQTFTNISKLDYDESINELVRISGGETITDSALSHAKEMKELAEETKKTKI